MTIGEIFLAQIADPFRIGLIVMLVVTAARTSGTVGSAAPLALGVAFVAVLIPTAMGDGVDTLTGILIGLISNMLILAVALGAKAAFGRWMRRRG